MLDELSHTTSQHVTSLSTSEIERLSRMSKEMEDALSACERNIETYISELPVGQSGLTEREVFIDFLVSERPRYLDDLQSLLSQP